MIDGSDPFYWNGGISKFPTIVAFDYLSFGDTGGPTDADIETESNQFTTAAAEVAYISFSESPLEKNLKSFRSGTFIDYEYRKPGGSALGYGLVRFTSPSFLGGLVKIPPSSTFSLTRNVSSHGLTSNATIDVTTDFKLKINTDSFPFFSATFSVFVEANQLTSVAAHVNRLPFLKMKIFNIG